MHGVGQRGARVTRRELVAGGAAGWLAGPLGTDGMAEAASAQPAEVLAVQVLREIEQELQQMRTVLRESLAGPSVAAGSIGEIRRQFTIFLRSNLKYPDYCEIGSGIFMELYDWHVRHRQALEITRVDNRMALRFMFTWMILRPEQAENHIGIPFDRP